MNLSASEASQRMKWKGERKKVEVEGDSPP